MRQANLYCGARMEWNDSTLSALNDLFSEYMWSEGLNQIHVILVISRQWKLYLYDLIMLLLLKYTECELKHCETQIPSLFQSAYIYLIAYQQLPWNTNKLCKFFVCLRSALQWSFKIYTSFPKLSKNINEALCMHAAEPRKDASIKALVNSVWL